MNLSRSHWQEFLYTAFLAFLSALILLALAPHVPAWATEAEGRWSDSIDEMIASGDYVEGEAIVALFCGESDALQAQAELPVDALEPLMEVSAEAAGVQEGPGLSPQAQQGVTLSLVSSDTLSTEEILRSLADDPRVVFAEPNYLVELCDEEGEAAQAVVAELAAEEEPVTPTEEAAAPEELAEEEPGAEAELETKAEAEEAVATDGQEATADPVSETPDSLAPADISVLPIAPQADGTMGDLTPLQWGNWDTTASGVKLLETSLNASINVPNFGEAEVGSNMDKEIVVAVLDGAIDFTNPDLEDRAYTFSQALQDQLGCDVHGFNASAESTDGKITHHFDHDSDSHGTHCAGIIGATWDGEGVSGVASNVKIVSVQLIDVRPEETKENDRTSLAEGLRGYDFVKRANEAGVGIKVTSNSWGFYQVSKALDAAVYELGESQGVVSVIAAFNDTKDNDVYPANPSANADNPYVVVVAASDQFDSMPFFTNYGTNTVALAAPGMNILSTDTTGRGIYLPAATPDSNILFEDFEGDSQIVTIRQFDDAGKPVGNPGTICTETHYMGEQSFELPFDTNIILHDDEDDGWSFLNYQGIRVDFDLVEAQKQTGFDIVESLKQAPKLYLGFGLTTAQKYSVASIKYIKTNMTEDSKQEIPVPPMNLPTSGSLINVSIPLTYDQIAYAFDNLDGHLILDIVLSVEDGCPALYFDEMGIGTQAVPYSYKSGTSMACPCVAGATAVLASQSGLDGAELASLVQSKVRIPASGPLPVRMGGIFDFNVQGSPDTGKKDAFGPVISDIDVSGTTVIITGSNFGTSRGSVSLARYVIGKEEVAAPSTVTLWDDDKVVLTLDAPFTGIMHATLTNASGKSDNASTFVSKGETVYEQDLPFTSDTGKPFVFDDLGDYETKGPLVGLGCKLYYLPADQRTEMSPVYQRMFCFDLKTNTWSEMPALPEMLQGVSAVLYEGKLVVEGATVEKLPSGEGVINPKDKTQEERVYVFDPATGAWSQAPAKGIPFGQTIINDGGKLKLVGGYVYVEGYPAPAPCYAYDPSTGLGEKICDLRGVALNPQAVAKDGVIYIYSPKGYWLVVVRDNESTMISDPLPEIAFVDKEEFPPMGANTSQDPFVGWGVLSVASDGIILVGPPAADGSSDTYIFNEGSKKFEPYAKRASDAHVGSVASCTYRGRLFAIGSSWIEPDQRFFRATAMDVPEYPGDIPCDKDEPTPEPAPKPAPALPKTSDPNVPVPVLVGIGACGVAAVVTGIILRRKK